MKRLLLATVLAVILVSGFVLAQQFRQGGRNYVDRSEFPIWENEEEFEEDVFTFVRIRYIPNGRRGWDGDYPEADLNISYRLQELTSIKVNPNPVVLELTDRDLKNYPFVFLFAPWSVNFSDAEVAALRDYLLSGGFLMVDEFWGPQHWDLFYYQIKRALPEFEPRELPLEHEIFHNVYDFKEKPQVVPIHIWRQGYTYHPMPGVAEDPEPHFYGIFDDTGRMMVLLCHNNDLVDGWEREGEDEEFFRQYSERNSYPMGINIITYVMTH